MSEVGRCRWAAFSPVELAVINEALNTAFEGGDAGRWDDEAQKIAATIPPHDQAVIDELNEA